VSANNLPAELFREWGAQPTPRGVLRFQELSFSERSLADEVWRAAWDAAIQAAVHFQDARSTSRHGYDKHEDSEALQALRIGPAQPFKIA